MGADCIKIYMRFKETTPTVTWLQKKRKILQIIKNISDYNEPVSHTLAQDTVLEVHLDEVYGDTGSMNFYIIDNIMNQVHGVMMEIHYMELSDSIWYDECYLYDGKIGKTSHYQEDRWRMKLGERTEPDYDDEKAYSEYEQWTSDICEECYAYVPDFILIKDDGSTDNSNMNQTADAENGSDEDDTEELWLDAFEKIADYGQELEARGLYPDEPPEMIAAMDSAHPDRKFPHVQAAARKGDRKARKLILAYNKAALAWMGNKEIPENWGISEEKAACSEVEKGGVFEFGKDPETDEPLEWIALDKQSGTILAISRDVLGTLDFHKDSCLTIWRDSLVRAFLNKEFLHNGPFSEEEQKKVKTVSLITKDYSGLPVETEDAVFLLSEEEVRKYFTTAKERAAEDGEYWGLRSVKKNGESFQYVTPGGMIKSNEYTSERSLYHNSTCNLGVRPALWINI